MADAQSCINCGEPVTSNYCANCGQKTKPNPITWKGLFVELTSRWFGTDNRLYRTFSGLTVRPHIIVEEYLKGNRVRYIGPLSYVVLMGFLYVLSFEVLDITPREMFDQTGKELKMPDPTTGNTEKQQQFQQKFMDLYVSALAKNMRLLVGLMIPFFALSLHIFYKQRNYLENILASSYLVSHTIWLSILANILYSFTGELYTVYIFIITVGYYSWVFGKLNPSRFTFWSFIKPFFVWVAGYFFFLIFVILITIFFVIQTINQG